MTTPPAPGDDAPGTAAGPDHIPHRPGQRPRRSRLRIALYAGSLAILVAAAGFAPLPLLRYVPGTPQELPDLIQIAGTETTEVEGRAALLTVLLDPVTPLQAVGVLLDPATSLTPIEAVAPEGGLTPDFFAAQREQFSRTFEIAGGVGAEAAGVEVSMSTTALIRAVVEGGPADGTLRIGDEVRSVDGEPIDDAAQLKAITSEAEAGDELTMVLQHPHGGEREVTIPLDVVPATGDVGLGVMVETVSDRVELPFDLALSDTRIGGPSAGLMTALTVYDLLADEDLIAGRTVVGTGTIGPGGAVGPVGGVASKTRAAVAYGADVVLVPAPQVEEALATSPPNGVQVVGVATFDDALEALRAS